MATWTPWSAKEREILHAHFTANRLLPTTVQRIQKVNPNRSFESVSRELRRLRWEYSYEQPREQMERGLRVGYLDIEATHLKANWGHMLSWCIKTHGKKKIHKAVITRDELLSHHTDRRIVEELLAAFEHFDVLWAHYGADFKFDLPYIRTRALKHGLADRVPWGDKFVRDTWHICKKKLKLDRNRLETIARHLGIEHVKKTPLDGETWQRARIGDKKALKYVLDHNVADVLVLEEVVKRLEPVIQPIYTRM